MLTPTRTLLKSPLMKRIAATLLFCLIATAANALAQSPQDLDLAKQAVTAHSTGNLLLEQILLRRLMIESSGDQADAARHRLAENALERGDYTETIRLLNAGDGTADEKSPQARRDGALIGEAYRRSGDTATATQVLGDVLAATPNPTQPDDADLLAVKSLDTIGGDIDEGEHFRRASVYQFNRYWDEARAHYKFVKKTADAAEALFQIGRGYTQSSEYENAIPYYQSVIDNYAETQQAKDSLLQLAAAYSRVDSTDHAISLYQSFIAKYPSDDKAPRAYLNIVDIYRDLGDDAHALKWCQKTEAAFTGKTPEALAVFDEAKIHASRSEWQEEIAALDRLKGRNDLGGASQPGGTTSDEVAFTRAYALEQLGRTDDAIKAYANCCKGHFYGESAFRRVSQLDPTHTRSGQVSGHDLPPESAPPPEVDLPEHFYGEPIKRRASAHDLPRGLLLAIMGQESIFHPQARSAAAARGLMQFTHP
ncbi:MAG: tetratricopeptide repeat protein, partial [Pyrinomonadaceae bacterium]